MVAATTVAPGLDTGEIQNGDRALTEKHWRELKASAIDPAIARLNFRTVNGGEAWDFVMSQTDPTPGGKHRRKDGRLRDWILRKYEHLDGGGLLCTGLDPLNNWQPMEWGQLKPNTPRVSIEKDGKLKKIKYEAPLGTQTRAFFLRVPWKIGFKIAKRYGLEDEYERRIQGFIEAVEDRSGSRAGGSSGVRSGRAEGLQECQVLPDAGEDSGGDEHGCKDNRDDKATGRADWLEYEDAGFWQWAIDSGIPIGITEGAKKAAALLSKGFAAIALPGVWNGQIKPQHLLDRRKLKPELQIIAEKDRDIAFVYDSDTKRSTRKNVAAAILATGRVFRMEGCTVSVWQWEPEKGKGIDDFIVGGGDIEEVADRAKSLDRFGAAELFRLTYPASIVIDPNQKYIGDLDIPHETRLIGIKAPKGSGKTETLAKIVYEAQQRGIPCLVITHRIQLAKALAARFGIPHVSEVKDSPEGKALGYALCFDSLHKDGAAGFDPSGWHDAYVVVDEAEQALWHLLESGTEIAKKRTTVLDNFRELLYNVLTSDEGKVFLADADLSDCSIDFVLRASGLEREIRPFIVRHHDRPGSGYHVTVYEDGDPAGMFAKCQAAIANGDRVLIHLTGQKAKSRWSATNLEQIIRRKFPELRVLRVDSHTVADPSHPAFNCVANVNGTFTQYDVVIATPTIETGVSIDLEGHFQSVWVIATGVTTADAVRQTMMRLREPVPRHLWCPTYAAAGKIGGGDGSSSPFLLLNCTKKRVRITLQTLKDADLNAAIEQDIDEPNLQAAQWTWAKMAARANSGFNHYREAIVDGLRDEGCEIEFVESDREEIAEVRGEVADGRDETWKDHREAVAAAAALSDTEYQKTSEKRDKTEDEHHQCERYEISERYGVDDVTPELVEAHEDGTGAKWHSHYLLFRGRKYLEPRDTRKLRSLKERGAVFVPDAAKRVKSFRIEPLDRVGITQLLQYAIDNPNETWHNSHPKLVELRKRCEKTTDLRVTIAPPREGETNIRFFKRICDRFAFSLDRTGRFGGGDREWRYRFSVPADGREEVFDRWEEQDEKALQKERNLLVQSNTQATETSTPVQNGSVSAESLVQKGLEVDSTPSTHGYINNIERHVDGVDVQPLANGGGVKSEPAEPANREGAIASEPPKWTGLVGRLADGAKAAGHWAYELIALRGKQLRAVSEPWHSPLEGWLVRVEADGLEPRPIRCEWFVAESLPAGSPPAQPGEVEELREMLEVASTVEADEAAVETVEALRSIAPRETLRAAFSRLGESAKHRIRQLRAMAIASSLTTIPASV